MSSSLISKNPHIQVNLWHLDRMSGRTVKVKALVVFFSITLISIDNVLLAIFGFKVDAVPTGRKFDVQFKF